MLQNNQKQTQFDKQLNEWQRNDSLILKNSKLLHKIHKNTKKNTFTQKFIHERKSRPLSSPTKSIQIKNSMNQLRLYCHQEQQQSQKLKNRLKYLHTSTERQQKLVHSAKLKFNQINQIRRKSFTDKSFFSKQRNNLLSQYSKTVSSQVNKVKSQRQKAFQSQKNIQIEKHNLAQSVRHQRQTSESFMKEKKEKQRTLLSKKVQKMHKQQDLQRQKGQSRSRQRIQQGILNHKREILERYKRVQQQMVIYLQFQKVNEKMLRSFQKEASQINEKKKRQQGELEEFRRFLGLNKSELNCRIAKSLMCGHMMSESAKKQSESAQSTGWSLSPKRRIIVEKEFYLTNPE